MYMHGMNICVSGKYEKKINHLQVQGHARGKNGTLVGMT